MKFTICVVYLLTLCITFSLSLKCYVCNSFDSDNCFGPLPTVNLTEDSTGFLEDCNNTMPVDAEDVLCRKIESYVEWYNEDGTKRDHGDRTWRECGYKFRDGSDDYAKREEDYSLYVYQCNDKDGCNTAPQSTAFKTALLLIPFFICRYA